ncbi:MAG TPA: branched-chain amino acid ABC transporter permease [Solirubrobacteraceae bacterium]|jgi:branched-chain amino acid transport system permease protein
MNEAAHPSLRANVRLRPRGAQRLLAAAALGFAAVLPFFFDAGSPTLDNLVQAAAYVSMALGLNIVVGFAGLLDLGYVAFFAIGAHVTASLASAFWDIHFNFLLILVLAVVATTTAGVVIGVPTLRLRGAYVGIVTLAFGEIIGQIAYNGREIRLFGGSLTAGPNGITPIDPIDLPFLRPFDPLDLRPWYWVALTLVALTLFVNFRLRDSRIGRAWIALRDDEEAAATAGVPIARTKLQAYGLGAALGGATGAFLASYFRTVNPTQFTFSFSIFILAMVVVGGLGSIWGVVAGAIVLAELNSYLLPRVFNDVPSKVGLDFDLSAIASGVYGFLLVAIMLLRPEGLLPERRHRIALRARR